ncbi:hypothetical protein BDV96DRAFT_571269 [Lophiotrema nucula]|uniref:Uncharacterized protein n=1 Tax=Lophiotrema nucula TaxID=690887 RepID=A0A6A5ZFL6_9PLEO|nr:hypothetical protein BDV96DRAFT_571269 [Lophiotrema nucula]
MSTFVINSISTEHHLRVTDTSGRAAFPGKVDIWTALSPHTATWYPDGKGSKVPIIYPMILEPSESWDIPMSLIGLFIFPSTWSGRFVVQGRLQGEDDVVFESDPEIIPPPTNPPIPVPIAVLKMHMKAPAKDVAPCIPFGWVGDFEWSITNVENDKNTAKCIIPTRLELYWSLHQASSGPLLVRSEVLETRVDFASSYPVELLRLFWPQPTEFEGVPNLDDYDTAAAWYAQRAVRVIWSLEIRPKFDSALGASSYGMTCLGGYFDLKRWLDSDVQNASCNSFDLAGVLQLACAVYLNRDGMEPLRSRWVLQEPYGLVPPGSLYGWDEPQDCNNPYFLLKGSKPLIDPTKDPLELDVGRAPFTRRAWVEAYLQMGSDRRVIDVTHCPKGTPEYGSKSREDYSTSHIDSFWKAPEKGRSAMFGNLQNNSAPFPSGSCYTEPDYRLSIRDNKAIDRIGVRSVNSVGTLPRLLEDLRYPLGVRTAVEKTLTKGRNASPPALSNCNASFDAETVCAQLSGIAHAKLVRTSTMLGKDRTRRTIECLLDAPAISLRIDIGVHTSLEAAINTMVYHLAGFETNIDEIGERTNQPLGSISVRTPLSVFWANGNVFVNLRISSSNSITSEEATVLDSIAKALDEYLESSKVSNSNQLRPAIALRQDTPVPTTVKVGDSFTVQIEDTADVASESFGMTDIPDAIVAGGVMAESGNFDFLAAVPRVAVVSLVCAHKTTLYPATASYIVEVVPDEDLLR